MNHDEIEKTYLSISDVKIYCERIENDKPPLVLIHGFLSSTYTFNRMIPLLKNHFSILAIDLPGFGRSEKSTTFRYTYTNYAKLVVECMRHFGIQKASIAGHSMGGQIGLNIANLYPNMVDKLVLICSSGYLKRAKSSLIFYSYLPFFSFFAKRLIQKREVKEELKNVLFNHTLINDEMMREFSMPLKDRNFHKSLIRLLRHREGDLETEVLKRITTEALLIWGKEDKIVPYEIGLKLRNELPNSSMTALDGCGHLITFEKPKEVVEKIITFLK